MDTWRNLNPELEYRVWDEAAIASFGLANENLYRRFIDAALYDGAADVARIEILERLGGVYADADSIALRSIKSANFMRAEFFAAWEPRDRRDPPATESPLVSNAFIGSVPNHPVLTQCIDRQSAVGRELKPMWFRSGPGMLTEVLSSLGFQRATVLPAWTFFTRSLTGEQVAGGDWYAEHGAPSRLARKGRTVA
jgi:mannosyltransferase OCH1-like enzyme